MNDHETAMASGAASASDTNVGTIEQQYGVDFGVRSDMQLETLRRQTGLSSIQELLRHARHQGSN